MAKTAKPIQHSTGEEKESRVHRPEAKAEAAGVDQEQGFPETTDPASSLSWLQHQVGNRAVQRLLTQRSGEGPFELDDETASRIDRERSGGQPLEENTRDQMETALGQDFSGVKVHTTPEANTLNRQLGAEAFTTGQDIYFREGAYNPQSSEGQELLTHEMTHVVQQASGQVSGGGGMTVNAPEDALEQQADAVAQEITSEAASGLQREAAPEEEEEAIQPKALQRDALPEEEEETLQKQELEEEEEEMVTRRMGVQREAAPEEEEVMTRRMDIQRQVEPEDEEVQTRRMDEEEVAGPGQTTQAPAPLSETAPAQQAAPPVMALPAETTQAPAPMAETAPAQQAGPASAPAMAPPAATTQAPAAVSEAAPAPEAKAETSAAPAPTPAGGPAPAGAEIEQIENAAAQQSAATRQELEQLYKF